MENFQYYTPTKIIFGRGAEEQTGQLAAEQGCKKVLVHYGGGSVVRSGLLEQIYRSLDAVGISYVSLGGVVPNPRLSLVYEGIRLARKEQVDFILAVGGGSVIDSAKAIGYGVANEGDVWDFYEKRRTAKACLPIGVVLTIAAAGSEMSRDHERGRLAETRIQQQLCPGEVCRDEPGAYHDAAKISDCQRMCGHYDAYDGALFQP